MIQLENLLQQCTVQITIPGQSGWGTGFFVAPGMILTCAHVVKALAIGAAARIRWQQQADFATAELVQLEPQLDLALLQFTTNNTDLPCVYLDEALQTGQELYFFGYPDQDFNHGCPVTGSCEGFTGDVPPLIKFKQAQVRPGMSGSPLLNQRIGKVCGMVKFTRDRSIDLGGGAIPTRVILEQFPQLRDLQREFHQRDRRWNDLLAANQIQIALESRIGKLFQTSPSPSYYVDRLTHLQELQKRSRAMCIARFRIAVVSREEAVNLADDQSLGVLPDSLSLESGKIIFLTGEIGIGKTLIAQRLFQQAIQQAMDDPNAPIPVYMESEEWKRERPLIRAVEARVIGLGQPNIQGATVFLDGLDEVDARLANQILREAYFLVEAWQNTTLVITSRPIPCLNDVEEETQVAPLSEQQAYQLLERVSGQQVIAMTVSGWTDTVKDAIRRPLFALILARYLQQNATKAPRSVGELISWLVKDALKQANVEYRSYKSLLKSLAVLSIESASGWVCAADVAPTEDAWEPLLEVGLVFERSRGIISFPLPILTEWFAAESLADNPSIVRNFVQHPQRLENWRYPLAIAMATFSHDVVSTLLEPIAETFRAFAVEVVREGSSRWGNDELPLPSFMQCGQQIQQAMQAWVNGLGPLTRMIAPVQQDGSLRSIGTRLQGNHLQAAWYDGSEDLGGVIELPSDWSRPGSQERNNWISGKSSRLGHERSWAWRWTRDTLVSKLEQKLEFPTLEVESEPLIHEAAWRAALAIVEYRQAQRLTSLKTWRLNEVPLTELEATLSHINEQAKLNCDIDLSKLSGSFSMATQHYHLRQLRREIDRLKSEGEANLGNPWAEPDQSQGAWIWDQFSPEQLLTRANAVYKGALNTYQKLTETWFTPFLPGMQIAAALPARLIGIICSSSLEPGSYGASPYIDWFLQALPEGADNDVEIRFSEDGIYEKYRDRMDLASQQLNRLRPRAAVWIGTAPTGGGGLPDEFFQTTPVTVFVYSWLQKDLQGIFGFGSFVRKTNFG